MVLAIYIDLQRLHAQGILIEISYNRKMEILNLNSVQCFSHQESKCSRLCAEKKTCILLRFQ